MGIPVSLQAIGLAAALIMSGGAMAAAENPHQAEIDRATADKALADAQTATATAQKAQYEAQAAALKAKMGDIPSSGFTGTATAGTNAGGAEAMLLATKALDTIATAFAEDIKKLCPAQPPQTILLYSAAAAPDFTALGLYEAQFKSLQSAVDNARQAVKPEIIKKYSIGTAASSLAAIGLGLDAVGKLLSFAKSDYSFAGAEVPVTDAMLMSSLAGKLKAVGCAVMQPGDYLPDLVAQGSAFIEKNEKVLQWRLNASQYVAAFQRAQAKAEKDLAAAPGDQTLLVDAEEIKKGVTAWTAVGETIDAWNKVLATADDKGVVPLAQILRQAALKPKLDAGSALLLVQVHKAAGETYTKKNLLSSLGKNPFYVMGGAVAGYTIFDGTSGTIVGARLMPVHGGYYSVSDIPAIVNPHPTAGGSQSSPLNSP